MSTKKSNTVSGGTPRVAQKNYAAATAVTLRPTSAKGVMRNDTFMINHREYSDQIVFSNATTSISGWSLAGSSSATPGYDLFPSNPILFPWLADQARHWEKYSFRKVTFHLYPRQGTSAQGWVSMAFDYDPVDAVPGSKRDMLTNMSLSETTAYNHLSLTVDCAKMNVSQKERFVTNITSETIDSRLRIGGFLTVAVDGVAPNTTLSWDLWTEYEVDFMIQRSDLEVPELSFSGAFTPVGTTTQDSKQFTVYDYPLGPGINPGANPVNLGNGIYNVNGTLPSGGINPNLAVPAWMSVTDTLLSTTCRLLVSDPSICSIAPDMEWTGNRDPTGTFPEDGGWSRAFWQGWQEDGSIPLSGGMYWDPKHPTVVGTSSVAGSSGMKARGYILGRMTAAVWNQLLADKVKYLKLFIVKEGTAMAASTASVLLYLLPRSTSNPNRFTS